MSSLEVAADTLRLWREKPHVMARELFGMVPDAWQDDVLAAFPHNQRQAMAACKGPGKTTVLALIGWNFLLTRLHPKVAATSISGDNLADNLWPEMATWLNRAPLLQRLFQWQKTRIFAKDHPETWFMSARTWSRSANREQQANTLAGFHADNLLFLIDEAGGIPDAVMAAAEAGLANTTGNNEAHIVMAGNPTHLEGPLYRACTTERKLWDVTHITADPDDAKRTPRVSAQWAREQIEKYGRDNPWVLVNVFGQFPPSSLNVLLGPDEVNAAMGRHVSESEYAGANRILGVDVAREGDDASVIYPRQGIVAFPPIMRRNINGITGAGLVARKVDDWGADATFVDNTGGFGASWIDQLALLNRSPIGVHFASAADDPTRYANKRAEMWFRMADWIKQGACLPAGNPEIVGELCAAEYFFKGDKFALIEKDQMKLKIGRSPDYADALGLTFAYPVAPRLPDGSRPSASVPMKQEYDPYARLN